MTGKSKIQCQNHLDLRLRRYILVVLDEYRRGLLESSLRAVRCLGFRHNTARIEVYAQFLNDSTKSTPERFYLKLLTSTPKTLSIRRKFAAKRDPWLWKDEKIPWPITLFRGNQKIEIFQEDYRKVTKKIRVKFDGKVLVWTWRIIMIPSKK